MMVYFFTPIIAPFHSIPFHSIIDHNSHTFIKMSFAMTIELSLRVSEYAVSIFRG